MINRNVIALPPLRERKVDILDLAYHFVDKYSTVYKKRVTKLSSRARGQLLGYDYRRGNIHELEEIINRGVALTNTDSVRSEQLFLGSPAGKANILYDFLRIKIIEKMVRNKGTEAKSY